ncbi:helix-turn-helix domain-containing protein [Eremococcus coleocola]|uniref:helix-turn-helix domain-containing protein n=1 Tax=Eremococcus coleocola TaxID=88132 RepID=UPI0003FA2476|nr:helix-turn-helix transcriptional regulator [Eremococcus coleocola]
MSNADVGWKIKKIRLNLGETMEEFGKRFNTSKGTVNNWEKGRNLPNKNNLLLIAELGNTTVNDLLTTPDDSTIFDRLLLTGITSVEKILGFPSEKEKSDIRDSNLRKKAQQKNIDYFNKHWEVWTGHDYNYILAQYNENKIDVLPTEKELAVIREISKENFYKLYDYDASLFFSESVARRRLSIAIAFTQGYEAINPWYTTQIKYFIDEVERAETLVPKNISNDLHNYSNKLKKVVDYLNNIDKK